MIRLTTFASVPLAAALLMGADAPRTPPPIDPAKVTMEVTKLGPGVAVIFGQGGNVGVSYGPDGTVLVDDQFAPLTPKLTAAAATLDQKPVRFVIDTHWHFDHTGGNENLGKAGAVIVAHDNVRARMSTEQFMAAFNFKFPPSPKEALPVVTFSEGVTMHLNGDTLRVVHVKPAHTDGDSFVKWEKANVLHTGDVFIRAGAPFIDRSSGGSVAGMIAALDVAIGMTDDATKVIPGHGPMSSKADIVKARDALKDLLAKVTAEHKAGKSVDQVLALKLQWPAAAAGPMAADGLVRVIYDTVSGK
jgi:glyoxylase-like metal-dependent hydrolase (beta-lactamase superfamily II)